MSLNRSSAVLAAAAMGAALFAASPSFAGHTASATISIRAVAQTVCRVELNTTATPVPGELVDLGQMTELCNDAKGYQVTLVTPAGLVGSQVVLDGEVIPVSQDGRTLIIDSNTDAFRKRDIKLQLGAGSPTLSRVSFTTQPKGAIY